MQLMIILIAASITIGILAAIISKIRWGSCSGSSDVFGNWFAGTIIIFSIAFIVLQLYCVAKSTTDENVTYNVKIVSLNDNSQINGKISGGMFYTRGYIGQVEYFSYYRDNGNGSYSLDKKEADRSIVIPDATDDTAYIKITDKMTTCKAKPTWYSIVECNSQSGIYLHGDFHVPANSIKNDFVLDAK